MNLRYTLISDGSSDRLLMPILNWALSNQFPDYAINGQWADLRTLVKLPRGLDKRISAAIDLHPCDLLFIHRDAESASRERRRNEIEVAVQSIQVQSGLMWVAVIPVTMTEAWLLTNAEAIKRAAGRPYTTKPVDLPRQREIEDISDPKSLLSNLLVTIGDRKGRRKKEFNPRQAFYDVADYTSDFSPLRALSAFRALEMDIAALRRHEGFSRLNDASRVSQA